jgi:hypothetical protein
MNAKLRKYCIFKGGEWIDIIRIHALPAGGYIVHHVEEEDLWIFDSLEEALEFVVREFVVTDKPLRVGECP